MAAGRKIRDEKEARKYLAAAKRSGVSIGDWARARGINGRSLWAWVMTLERREAKQRTRGRRPSSKRKSGSPAFVELLPSAVGKSTVGMARYTVEVPGGRVEFGDDASLAMLRQVFEALRSC
jgi:8-oxo-dGTP pyrophosphatase MutT (NUDIX family)